MTELRVKENEMTLKEKNVLKAEEKKIENSS